MPATVANVDQAERLNNLDVPRRQAKVHTVARKKVADEAERLEAARLINRAKELSGLTADQFAREVGMDPTRLSKQISNAEPPQLLRVFFSSMRAHVVQAMAEKTPGCEVASVITIRRPA